MLIPKCLPGFQLWGWGCSAHSWNSRPIGSGKNFIFLCLLWLCALCSIRVEKTDTPCYQVGRIIGKGGGNVREMQRLTGAVIKLPEQVSKILLPLVSTQISSSNHRQYVCAILTFNPRALQLERKQVCTSLDPSTPPSQPNAASERWWLVPPEVPPPPLRPPFSPMAGDPAPCRHYLPPPQTSRRHSSWCGRVAHWNLLKCLRLRSRPPHPRLTASSNRIFKEATIGIKSRLYKKHSRNLSFPRKHKARLRLTTHTFCLKYRVQTKMQTSLMQVEIKSQVSR